MIVDKFDNSPSVVKGATKLYFMHYSCVVFILSNLDLYKSGFPTYSFENLVSDLSVFFFFCLFCFELAVIFKDSSHFAIEFLCKVLRDFVLTLCKLLVKTKKIVLKETCFQKVLSFL